MTRIYNYIGLLSLTLLLACSGGKEIASKGGKSSPSGREGAAFQELFFKGQEKKALGETDDAYEAFQQAQAISPENDAVYYEMSRIDFAKERINGAYENIQKAIDLKPDNYWYHRLYADYALENGDFETAEKQLEWCVDNRPKQLEAYYDLAATFLYREDGDGAIKTYDRLEEQIGLDPELAFQKQRIYMLMGQQDKAVEVLDELIEAYPEPQFIAEKAELLLDMGRRDEAKQTLLDLIEKDPNNGLAHLKLSRFYVEAGENEKSWESIRIAFASDEVSIDDKINVLFRYYDLAALNPEAYGKAYQLLNILDETHPDDAKTHSMYGDFLMVDQQFEQARDRFAKAVEIDPSRQLIWMQLMELDAQLGDWALLREHGEKALELFPSQPTYYLMLGIGQLRTGAYEDAIQSFNAGRIYVVEDPPLSAGFWSNLGEAYNSTKEFNKSDEAFEKSLKKVADDPFVMNNYSYYLSLRGENLERAAELSLKSNELLPETASFQDTYGWILFKQGKYNDAKSWIGKALEGSTPDATLYEHYGDVLFKLGETEEGVKYWEEALQIGGGSELLQKKVEDKTYYEAEPE